MLALTLRPWFRRSRFLRLGGLGALAFSSALRADLTVLSRAVPVADTGQGASFTALFPTPPGAMISADGRYAVFLSRANNLVPGQLDPPIPSTDVFLRDRVTGQTVLVSHAAGAPAGTTGADSSFAVISADGAWVAFVSQGRTLVAGQADGPGSDDVFLYSRATGQITLISHDAASPTQVANQPSGDEGGVALSADGRYLAFVSAAGNLIAGQVNGAAGANVFLYDRVAGSTVLVSHTATDPLTTAGGRDLSLSDDGRFVAFASGGAQLVAGQVDGGGIDLFLFDRTTAASSLITHAAGAPLTAAGTVSKLPAVSGDGNFVAYVSAADNLVAGQSDPAGNAWDVFLWDRATGGNVLASRSAAAATTAGDAVAIPDRPALSADGRFVLFESNATNLVPGQIDAITGLASITDLFLFDRATGTTALVSHLPASAVTAANQASGAGSISADGNFVAFGSLSPGLAPGQAEPVGEVTDGDVFLYSRATGGITLVSRAFDTPNGTGLGGSFDSRISADGRFVLFTSSAPDIQGVDANGADDVFLYNRTTGDNILVSAHAPGMASVTALGVSQTWATASPTLSADGRFVAFTSNSPFLLQGQSDTNGEVDVFLADRLSGAVTLVSRAFASELQAGQGISDSPSVSADGRFVAFRSNATDLVHGQSDSAGTDDIFLFDRATRTTMLVSRSATSPTVTGNQASGFPALSADGRTVAFASAATDLVAGVSDGNGQSDVFLYDRLSGARTLVTHAAGGATTAASNASSSPLPSADGAFVAYLSLSTDLVAGATDTNNSTDVFLYDRAAGTSSLVSHRAGSAAAGNGGSASLLGVSAAGRFVLYGGTATDLVAGQADANGAQDLFLYDRTTGTNALVTHAATSPTVAGNGAAAGGVLSADGRYVAFLSTATNLVSSQIDIPGSLDLFLYDRTTGAISLISRADGTTTTAAGDAASPALSADGRFLAFSRAQAASPFPQVPGVLGPVPRDAYLYDRNTDTVRLLSHSLGIATQPGNSGTAYLAVSADGRSVAFTGEATDLVAGDLNGTLDVFLERATPATGRFFTVAPCRLLDTRAAGQGPALLASAPEIWSLHALCGIPSTARAVSLNLTVVAPTADGYLSLYPGDQVSTAASTINFRAGQVRANNALARLALDGSGTLGIVANLAVGTATVHVVLDVNGYFE